LKRKGVAVREGRQVVGSRIHWERGTRASLGRIVAWSKARGDAEAEEMSERP